MTFADSREIHYCWCSPSRKHFLLIEGQWRQKIYFFQLVSSLGRVNTFRNCLYPECVVFSGSKRGIRPINKAERLIRLKTHVSFCWQFMSFSWIFKNHCCNTLNFYQPFCELLNYNYSERPFTLEPCGHKWKKRSEPTEYSINFMGDVSSTSTANLKITLVCKFIRITASFSDRWLLSIDSIDDCPQPKNCAPPLVGRLAASLAANRIWNNA